MNKKLSDWASIAEIASAVAVLITLIFIVLSINKNTAVVRAAAYDDLMMSLNSVALTVGQNAEWAQLIARIEAGQIAELDDDELLRIRVVYRSLWRIYEASYFGNQYGTIGESEWSRLSNRICRARQLFEDSWWTALIAADLSPEFVDYVSSTCPQG